MSVWRKLSAQSKLKEKQQTQKQKTSIFSDGLKNSLFLLTHSTHNARCKRLRTMNWIERFIHLATQIVLLGKWTLSLNSFLLSLIRSHCRRNSLLHFLLISLPFWLTHFSLATFCVLVFSHSVLMSIFDFVLSWNAIHHHHRLLAFVWLLLYAWKICTVGGGRIFIFLLGQPYTQWISLLRFSAFDSIVFQLLSDGISHLVAGRLSFVAFFARHFDPFSFEFGNTF